MTVVLDSRASDARSTAPAALPNPPTSDHPEGTTMPHAKFHTDSLKTVAVH